MSDADLSVLLLDQDRNQALLLADFLIKRGASVETCLEPVSALAGAQRRALNGRPYDLIIISHGPPVIDGMAVVAEFRQRQTTSTLVMTIPFGPDSPTLHQQGRGLGCKLVLDQPVDLAEVDKALRDVQSAKASNAAVETGSFFPPTGQHTATDNTGSYRTPSGPYQRQTSTTTSGTGYTRLPSSSALDPHTRFTQPRHTTARVRRSVGGNRQQPHSDAEPDNRNLSTPANRMPLPPGTKPLESDTTDDPFADIPSSDAQANQPPSSRFRRRTGHTSSFKRTAQPSEPPAPPAAVATKQVGCAHCHQAFSVAIKPEAYTVVCIHCGGLNRIDP